MCCINRKPDGFQVGIPVVSQTPAGFMAHKTINFILQVAVPDARGIESTGVWVSFPSFSTHLLDVYATMYHNFVFDLYFTL